MAEPTAKPKPAAETVAVVAPTGVVRQVTPDEAFELESRGYRSASMSEVRANREDVENRGALPTALAVATGAARAVPGVSDYLIPKLAGAASDLVGGRDGSLVEADTKRRMLALQEHQAGASLLGELAGGFAFGNLAGGGKLATAENAAARAMGGGGMARAGAGLMRGALEGGAYGAGSSLGRASLEGKLGDPALVAERLVGGLKDGALFGGGASLALSALGGAGRGLMGRRGAGALDGPVSASAAASLERKLLPGRKGNAGLRHVLTGAEGKDSELAMAALRGESDAVIESGQKRMAELLTGINGDESYMRRLAGDMKADTFAGRVAKGDEFLFRQETQARTALDRVEGMFRSLDDRIAAKEGVKLSGPANELRRELEWFRKEVNSAAKNGQGDRLFILSDNLKKRVGLVTDAADNAAMRKPQFKALAKDGKDVFEDLRQGLQDPETWGDAGRYQKSVNAPIHEKIGVSDTYHKNFSANYGNDPHDAWRKGVVADPKKLKSWAEGLGKEENALVQQSFDDMLRTAEERNRAHLEFAPEGSSAAKYAQAQADKIAEARKLYEEISGAASQRNAAERLKSADAGSGLAQGLLGGAAGMVAFGPAGALLAPALSYVSSPYKVAKTIATMSGIADRAATSQSRAISAMGKWYLGAERRLAGVIPEMRRTTEALGPVNAAKAAELVSSKIAPAAPEVSGQVKRAMERIATVALLRSPFRDPASPFVPPPTPSKTERAKFENAVSIVRDMPSAISRIVDGSATVDQARAFAEAYPAQFEDMRSNVLQDVAAKAASGSYMSPRKLIRLGLLLDLPLDPSLEPDAMMRAQEVYGPPMQDPAGPQAAAPQPKPNGKPIKLASRSTGSDETEKEME